MKRLSTILLVGLVLLSIGSQARWDKLWDKQVGTVVVHHNLLENTTKLFATNKTTGDLYRYQGSPNNWERVSGPGKMFVSTGEWLCRLSTDGNTISQYHGGNSWETIGGKALKLFGGGNKLYVTKPPNGDLYEYTGTIGRWKVIGGPGKTFAAAGLEDIHNGTFGHIYRINPDGNSVWDYPKDFAHMEFEKIGGPAAEIYAGGNYLFATDPVYGDIYKWTGVGEEWEPIGGPGKMFAVDVVGTGAHPGYVTLYGLSGDGMQIWRWEGQPEQWTQIPTAAFSGPLDKIYAGGGELYAVTGGNHLYKYVP